MTMSFAHVRQDSVRPIFAASLKVSSTGVISFNMKQFIPNRVHNDMAQESALATLTREQTLFFDFAQTIVSREIGLIVVPST